MTRAECVALLYRYAEYDGMGIPNLAGCKEAVKMAADLLSQPSLPSGLDEAAEEYVKTTSVKVWGRIDPKKDLKGYMARANYGTGLLDGFRAGAEWMAGQGITFEGKASRRYENDLAGFVSWILFDQQKAAHLLVNQGEEADVVINIRKK